MIRKALLAMFALLVMVSFASAQDSNPTFVFVHGAFQNSSSWDEVVALLNAEGYSAISVNLPGRDNDETALAEISLDTYRDTVVSVIEAQDAPVILVGHSFAGITISQVAEIIPERIQTLIYVAAYLPRNGDSLAGLAELDHHNGFNENNFLLAEDFTYAYVLEDDFLSIFCADCNEEQAEAVMASRQNEPLAPLNEAVTISDANFGSVHKVYIMTAEDNAVSPQLQAFMISQTPVDHVYALNTSHLPFVVMPEALTSLLIDAIDGD